MDYAPCSFSPFICAFGNKLTAGGQPLVLFDFMYFIVLLTYGENKLSVKLKTETHLKGLLIV